MTGLPDEFHTVMGSDKDKCDLLIVMGSSLKVRPVALIPSSIPNNVPQILINREQLHHLEFDVELLGDGDVIINQICHRLGEDWKEICFDDEILRESHELITLEDDNDDAEEKCSQEAHDRGCNFTNSTLQPKELVSQSGTAFSDSDFDTSSTSLKRGKEFLPPDYLDEPMESTDFGSSCEYRHLSIDSSKDSGILGDGSNSALPPAFSNYPDTAGDMKKSLNMPATTTQAISKNCVDNLHSTKMDTTSSKTEKQNLRRQQRHQSAAERLHQGTYYAHDLSASYVFPGAQVSWNSDSEEDDDDINVNPDVNDGEEEYETNNVALSPLMTPSVENEMVKSIDNSQASTLNNFSNVISSNSTTIPSSSSPSITPEPQQKKRHSNEPAEKPTVNANTAHSPPPHKKRRDSDTSVTSSPSTCNQSLSSS